MTKLNKMLSVLSILSILVAINRFVPITREEFLEFRWVELNMMLLTAISFIVFVNIFINFFNSNLLKSKHGVWTIIFFSLGMYLYALSTGIHESTNALGHLFCNDSMPICNAINFHDNAFSHYLYFISLIVVSLSLSVMESIGNKSISNKKDIIVTTLNALIFGLGIFINTAFESAKIDLIICSILVLTVFVRFYSVKFDVKSYAFNYYVLLAFGVGTLGSIFYKSAMLFL